MILRYFKSFEEMGLSVLNPCNNICKILVVVSLLLALPLANALEVESPTLPSKVNEGEEVEFEIKISDFKYADKIVISTSLEKLKGYPIFYIKELDKSYDDQYIEIPAPKNLNSLTVRVKGKAPLGTYTKRVDGVEVTKFRDEELIYYQVALYQKNEKEPIENTIKHFKLNIKVEEEFKRAIQDIPKEFQSIKDVAEDLFEKGLVSEAFELVDATKKAESVQTPKWLIALPLLVFIVGYLLGRKHGFSKCEELMEVEKKYE